MLQVTICGALLTIVGILLLGLEPAVAFVAGMGFVLTSTAIVLQLLAERGDLQTPGGQKIVSILLLEDISIVPLLAIVALLAPGSGTEDAASRWISVGVAVGAVVAVIFAGRWVLNPVFRILAESRAREVMTAAALLVVLGRLAGHGGGRAVDGDGRLPRRRAALHLDLPAPARGRCRAVPRPAARAVLPRRGDVARPRRGAGQLADGGAGGGRATWLVKGAAIYGLARLLGPSHAQALERALLMAQGGEFAFVLYTTAAGGGILTPELNAMLTATVIISMVLTPFTVMLLKLLPEPQQSLEGVEPPDGLKGNVLVIGFGRFGQIASQPLLARGLKVAIIDNDTDMIRAAGQFGMKVYYGDGTRLDILHAAGAANADAIIVAVDKKDDVLRIVELIKSEFPLAKLFVRAFDRGHALQLVGLGVDYQVRELFESALQLGSGHAPRHRGQRPGSRRHHRGRARARPPALRRPAGRRHPGGQGPAPFQRRGPGARERRGGEALRAHRHERRAIRQGVSDGLSLPAADSH